MDIQSLDKLVIDWFNSQKPLPSEVTVQITLTYSSSKIEVKSVSEWQNRPLSILITPERLGTQFTRIRNCFTSAEEDVYWGWEYHRKYFGNVPFSQMTIGQFVEKCKEKDLLRIPNFGKKCLKALRAALSEIGYPSLKIS